MALTITIDSTDRSDDIDWTTFRKKDNLYSQADILEFEVKKYGGEGFVPSTGDTITSTLDSTKIFSGVIINVTKRGIHDGLVIYRVRAKSEDHFLDRQLVLDTYSDTTVEDIISDIISTYTTGFTTNNVTADIFVETARFNRIPVSEAIDKLAEKTNYTWYVDYDKDIHFSEDATESAPFNITDDSDNKIFNTIELRQDFSQIRNKVTVRGGEFEGNQETEDFTAAAGQTLFNLAFKYASLPTVTLNSSSQSVGVDFLDDPNNFDALWDQDEQRLRFTSSLSDGDSVQVQGIPLIPILVEVSDDDSINSIGEYEFFVKDSTIESRGEAIERAKAEVEAYADDIVEGRFQTYTDGLKSGQQININSTVLNEDTDFIIKKVSTRARDSSGSMIYTVELQTARTKGIVETLQEQIFDEALDVGENQLITSFIRLDDSAEVTDDLQTPITDTSPYRWAPATNSDDEFKWGFGVWH